MEINRDNIESEDFFIFNEIKEFLSLTRPSDNIILSIDKIKPIFSIYCKIIITLFLNNTDKANIQINKRKRYINYIIKKFINENILEKNKYIIPKYNEDSSNILFLKFLLFCFAIFKEVFRNKMSQKSFYNKNLMLVELDNLLSQILMIISKLHPDKIFMIINLKY